MPKVAARTVDKGGSAEEALRAYFLQLGSYVVRGVPFRLEGEDVTDIDLWVYTRASANSRNIAVVDIKNKKRAKAFERLVWAKGIQSAVGADEAIVATTGRVEALQPFADRLNVRILAGSTLDAILARYGSPTGRVSSEAILDMWSAISLPGPITLKAKWQAAASELAFGLSFASFNRWLDDTAELLQLSADRERQPGELLRAAYLFASLVAVCGDYLGRNQWFADATAKSAYFRQGLLFGRTDPDAGKVYVEFAEQLITDFLDSSGASAATVRSGFQRSLDRLAINGLVEFLSRPGAGKDLVDGAIALEAAAFAPTIAPASRLPREAKTVLGLILDYASISRGPFLGLYRGDEQSSPMNVATDPNAATQVQLPFSDHRDRKPSQ